MIDNEHLWVEKYRPQTVAECILPKRLKSTFQDYVDKKQIPHLLLSGTAGVGKTTVAQAMCKEIGASYLQINSSDDRGINVLRTKIAQYASTVSLNGGHKVIIMDEADGLTPEAQDGLRGTMEKYSKNCTFILTCNFKSRLIDAIHSRCAVVDFGLKKEDRPEMAAAFFKRLVYILQTENVDYDKAVLVKIVEKFFPDYRRTLNELQRFSSSGKIDSGTLSQIEGLRNVGELVKHLKAKDFGEMRKWVGLNSDVESMRIFRYLYNGLYDFLKPESIPQAVVILGRYQYQAAFVADQEINTVAALTELMVDCEFKEH